MIERKAENSMSKFHERTYNAKKICVISCVNDEKLYQEMRLSFQSLVIPTGMTCEFIALRGERDIFSAYQKAMCSSDAKYKLYVHQDVEFIEKDFLQNLISAFQQNPEYGIIGVVGAENYNTNAIWWESSRITGAIIDGDCVSEKYYFEDMPKNTEVLASDGLFLATQYDLDWRYDIFSGWHFYDLSQCMEFRRAGFKAMVLGQKKTALMHKCGMKLNFSGFDEARYKFIFEYAEDIEIANEYFKDKNLVSVVLLANDDADKVALSVESVLNQSCEGLELIIYYTGINESVKNLIEYYKSNYANIKYEISDKTKYINYMLAGDVFLPKRIEILLKYANMLPTISMSVSEYFVLYDGKDVMNLPLGQEKLFEQYGTIDGDIFIDDFIDENISKDFLLPSMVLLKRRFLPVEWLNMNFNYQTFKADFCQLCLNILEHTKVVYEPTRLLCLNSEEKAV